MALIKKKNCSSLSQHCKLKMKYKITLALKHIMLTITSYIHNCDVDILRFTLYNINRTIHMTRTTARKELNSKSIIHIETNNHLYITVNFLIIILVSYSFWH